MTNRRTQLHIRIILKCPDPRSLSNPGHYGVSRVLSQGSGISCCPVQVGALILDLWPSRSVDLDLDYSGLYSADTTSDPRSMDADRLITSEPTMDQGSVLVVGNKLEVMYFTTRSCPESFPILSVVQPLKSNTINLII